MKLNRRGKIVRLLVGLLLLVFAFNAIAENLLKDAFKIVGYEEVIISDGDTVWMLCKKFNGKVISSSTGDIGECIHHFAKSNPKTSDILHPGDLVKMPLLAVNE